MGQTEGVTFKTLLVKREWHLKYMIENTSSIKKNKPTTTNPILYIDFQTEAKEVDVLQIKDV